MSGTAPPQSRTPRASRHKHSKSAVPTTDNESVNPAHKYHQKQSRNNTAGKPVDPAWQHDSSALTEGYFNDNGEFVVPPNFLAMTGNPDYGSPQAQQPGGKRTVKKQARTMNNHLQPNGNQSPQPTRHQNDQQHQSHLFSSHAITPAKTSAAYAGPTWNASPAPSALPVPKFFSKSMPQETSPATLQTRLDQESEQSDSAESPALAEAVAAMPTPPRHDDSPLDFLFRKDKEQKSKRKSTWNGALGFTPTRPSIGSFNTEPQRLTDWTSNHGIGASNQNQYGSNESNKEQFMMELDASNASPAFPKASPRPILNDRMSSAPSAVPQNAASPYQNTLLNGQLPMYGSPSHGNSTSSLMASPGQQHFGDRLPDASASPFYRGPQEPTRSAITSPMSRSPTQHRQNLHYGNRNLGPLFQAAKQDSDRHVSSLRQEVRSPRVAELPGNDASHFSHHGIVSTNRQNSINSDQVVRDYLLAQTPTSLPMIELPQEQFSNAPPPPGSVDLDAHVRPQSHCGQYSAPTGPNLSRFPTPAKFNAKSIEDDLKRMLKLSLTSNSFDSPGVH
ncbi:hypothetical protein FKW77_010517 [Venturia effusa]|uniref:Uncharacterized protein n=1 Tax=Venturia effusa TaxID=50376 RepID=A0A517L4M7_9PEZI|nr:hypothetical protein FKW77_010517 [Venturia effusa]